METMIIFITVLQFLWILAHSQKGRCGQSPQPPAMLMCSIKLKINEIKAPQFHKDDIKAGAECGAGSF